MTRLITILLISAAILFSYGCAKPKTPVTKKETFTGHYLTDQQAKKILSDTKDDINIILKAKNDESRLSKALTDPALKQTRDNIKADKQLGRIRIRVYKNIKLQIKNFTKPTAGLTLTFIDEGYYIDSKTNKPLTQPTHQKQVLLLAALEKAGRWKISEILSPQVKPETAPKKN